MLFILSVCSSNKYLLNETQESSSMLARGLLAFKELSLAMVDFHLSDEGEQLKNCLKNLQGGGTQQTNTIYQFNRNT